MLQVIKAEDVRDGEPRMYAFDAKDADDRVASIAPWELHGEKLGGYQLAIVDRPAPHYPPMPGTGAPRDPSRIDPILARLRAAWQRSPDLRLGQLIVGSIPIGHLDRADAIRRLFNAECHEFGASGAPVEWPAPSTAAQPPPVLDLDALEGRMRDGFGVHSDDVAHLIADARAAVALRSEVADLAAIRADERARYLRDGARHLAERDHALTALSKAKRLGLEACDAAQKSDDQMMWAPINIPAIRAALEAL